MSRLHPNIPFREAEGLNQVIYDVAKVPAVITEAVENFRDTSYDVCDFCGQHNPALSVRSSGGVTRKIIPISPNPVEEHANDSWKS